MRSLVYSISHVRFPSPGIHRVYPLSAPCSQFSLSLSYSSPFVLVLSPLLFLFLPRSSIFLPFQLRRSLVPQRAALPPAEHREPRAQRDGASMAAAERGETSAGAAEAAAGLIARVFKSIRGEEFAFRVDGGWGEARERTLPFIGSSLLIHCSSRAAFFSPLVLLISSHRGT